MDFKLNLISELVEAMTGKPFLFLECGRDREREKVERILMFFLISKQIAVHSAGIVHRDLKTKNMLLEATPQGKFPFRLRLADFGICRVIQNQDVKSQNFLNIFGISIKYAAPEVFSRSFLPNVNNDAEDEKKTDVYSFAVW